jgi:hypothetical protein
MKENQKILESVIDSGEVFSRYLFRSPDKHKLLSSLKVFVKSLLCSYNSRDEGCICISCQNLRESFQSKDLLFLHEDKYTVDNIPVISNFLLRKSFGQNPKVVFIHGIQNMNETAQNKFLKLLEELPSNVCVILTQTGEGYIAPTIFSRCLCLDFFKRSFLEFRQKTGDLDLTEEKSLILYRIFEGTLDFQYYEDLELIRKSVFYIFERLDAPSFIDKMRFPNYPFVSLKSMMKKYPFESNLRIINSFFLDRISIVSGSNVFYNLDYKDKIRDCSLTGKQLFSRASYLWKGCFPGNFLDPWIWLQGILIGPETV